MKFRVHTGRVRKLLLTRAREMEVEARKVPYRNPKWPGNACQAVMSAKVRVVLPSERGKGGNRSLEETALCFPSEPQSKSHEPP